MGIIFQRPANKVENWSVDMEVNSNFLPDVIQTFVYFLRATGYGADLINQYVNLEAVEESIIDRGIRPDEPQFGEEESTVYTPHYATVAKG